MEIKSKKYIWQVSMGNKSVSFINKTLTVRSTSPQEGRGQDHDCVIAESAGSVGGSVGGKS